MFAICAFRPAFGQVGMNVRDTGRKTAIDTCRLRVVYRFRYARDTTGGPAWYDRCALEAGDRLSRYYSLYGDRIDSLYFRARMKKPAADSGFNPTAWMEPQHRAVYEDCYMDHPRPGIYSNGSLTRSGSPAPIVRIKSSIFLSSSFLNSSLGVSVISNGKCLRNTTFRFS